LGRPCQPSGSYHVNVGFVSVQLGWFPPAGRGGIQSLTLPAVSLGAYSAAGLARLVRSGMLEVMSRDFVRSARAKGLRESWAGTRHEQLLRGRRGVRLGGGGGGCRTDRAGLAPLARGVRALKRKSPRKRSRDPIEDQVFRLLEHQSDACFPEERAEELKTGITCDDADSGLE